MTQIFKRRFAQILKIRVTKIAAANRPFYPHSNNHAETLEWALFERIGDFELGNKTKVF